MCPPPSFVIECDDCDMKCKTDDLDEALTFAVKHKQHTDHSVTWERSNLADSIISIPQRIRWKIQCDTCGAERIFREEEQAEHFYKDHEEYTDHSPQEPEQVQFPEISELDSSDIESVLDYCFENAETVDIVPTGVILEAFEEAGIGRKRTVKELEKVEAKTDVYHLGDGLLAR